MPNRCQMMSQVMSQMMSLFASAGMMAGMMTVATLLNPVHPVSLGNSARADSSMRLKQSSLQQPDLTRTNPTQNHSAQIHFTQTNDGAATATEVNGSPVFAHATQFSTTISGDPTDIYIPVPNSSNETISSLPIALMLPGALVERSQYSKFASIVARYGFAVVVPTHERSLPEFNVSGELAEASQINTVLAYMQAEHNHPSSPLAGMLDTEKMVLLGHSHGAAVSLMAISNICMYPFCMEEEFTRPDAVVAGVFYGVHTYNPITERYTEVQNDGIPVALIRGSQDGVATPDETQETYELIHDPPKALITVEGANHFGITNQNNPAGALPDASNPTLEQDKSVDTIARWSGLFLRAHVLEDEHAIEYIYDLGDDADDTVRVTSQFHR